MDSQPSAAPVTNVSPFAAMLRSSSVPSLAIGLVCTFVAFFLRGLAGGLSALFGAVITVAFFASGLWVLSKLRSLNPMAIMAAGMSVFFAQIIILGGIVLGATRVKALDGTATGVTMIIVVLAWQVFQVRSFMRTRQYVYDPDAHEGPA